MLLALSDERYMVRATAVEMLGKTNDPGAVRPVVTMLIDKSPDVRRAAATALGILRDRRAVEPLVAALKDEAPIVRESAVKSLRNITGQDFGEDQAKWREWREQN